MTNPADRIAEMFGSLTETSPGVFHSPVGLSPDELTTMAQSMVHEANNRDVGQALRNGHPAMGVIGERPLSEEDLTKASPAAAAALRLIKSHDPEADVDALYEQAQQMAEDFGPDPNFPDRPNHEDFRALARIIQQMDAVAEENSVKPEAERSAVESLMPFGVDAESVMYMAKQRALRGEELLSEEGSFYAKAVIMWLDAFTAGVRFGREQIAFRVRLDDSIDGNHRSGRVQ